MKYKLFLLIGFVVIVVMGSLALKESTINTIAMYLNQDLKNESRSIVIIPILTANAYKQNGFYDYYEGKCDESCLSVYVDQSIELSEPSNENEVRVLKRLGYPTISDYQLDKHLRINPDYLESFDKIIVLHSEYVTQNIFDALQKHHKVIYLNPNALYAEITIDRFTMTLVRGHGYPEETVANGFEWKYENTPLEYEKTCKDWVFIPIQNGYQLNCNPELIIYKNFEILKTLKDI